MHVDPKIEQAEVAAGVVVHEYAAIHFECAGHYKGRVPALIRNQGLERNVLRSLFGAYNRAARKTGSCLEGKSGCRPDRNKIRLERSVHLSFITATAFAGDGQTNNGYQGSADEKLPNQFPQFYGTQI
jgi:hypothetical protein